MLHNQILLFDFYHDFYNWSNKILNEKSYFLFHFFFDWNINNITELQFSDKNGWLLFHDNAGLTLDLLSDNFVWPVPVLCDWVIDVHIGSNFVWNLNFCLKPFVNRHKISFESFVCELCSLSLSLSLSLSCVCQCVNVNVCVSVLSVICMLVFHQNCW